MRKLNVGLTPEQVAKRRSSIGASDMTRIMSGDDAAVLRLWEEKTGQREPEDLSGVLPVLMGSWTEELNRYWFELQTGLEVLDVGREAVSATHPYLTATLDGIAAGEGIRANFEAKHVHANTKDETVSQKYMAQVHQQMFVTGERLTYLSVFFGTTKWEWFEIEYDEEYGRACLEAAELFWSHVIARTPPVTIAAPTPPKPLNVVEMMKVDMEGNNQWASLAQDWLDNKAPAARFDTASKELKDLMPNDAGEASGHGIIIKRAKNNSLRIGETK